MMTARAVKCALLNRNVNNSRSYTAFLSLIHQMFIAAVVWDSFSFSFFFFILERYYSTEKPKITIRQFIQMELEEKKFVRSSSTQLNKRVLPTVQYYLNLVAKRKKKQRENSRENLLSNCHLKRLLSDGLICIFVCRAFLGCSNLQFWLTSKMTKVSILVNRDGKSDSQDHVFSTS